MSGEMFWLIWLIVYVGGLVSLGVLAVQVARWRAK